MGATEYFDRLTEIISKVKTTQEDNIKKAAGLMVDAIAGDKFVYIFGSGHSILPALDMFPRYGSFVGFRPIADPRLMWFTPVGPGGAQELLWLERQEGYIANFLKSFDFKEGEVLLVFSHGGLNAAPIEAALYAKNRGMSVVAVTSAENCRRAKPTHSTGNTLATVADVVIDNCVPPEDALVALPGITEKVAGSSTVVAASIGASLIAQVGAELAQRGIKPCIFVSPNVKEIPPEHNQQVFVAYSRAVARHQS